MNIVRTIYVSISKSYYHGALLLRRKSAQRRKPRLKLRLMRRTAGQPGSWALTAEWVELLL